MRRVAFLKLAAMLLAFPSLSRAEALIYIYQDGLGNVVASGSGTLDTTDLTYSASDTTLGPSGVNASAGILLMGPNPTNPSDLYKGISGPTSFGSGSAVSSSFGSGDLLGEDTLVGVGYLFVPEGYSSGSSLSTTMTFSGQTLAGLGLTTGIYTFTWGNGNDADSLVVDIGDAPPPPSPSPAR
jgi:hypothetical protein